MNGMKIEWPDEWFDEEERVNTPTRVSNFIEELRFKQQPFDFKVFDNPKYDEIIALRNIQFYSICSHHLLPFSGKAHVGYLPRGKVCGISKLARAVDRFASRPQLQERLTIEIANFLNEKLSAAGIGVILEAEHTCMSCRGVSKDGSELVTSAMLGVFRNDPAARNEFLRLIGK